MIEILTTGGTIDKVYFDANSKFEIGDSLLPELLTESNIHDGYEIRPLMRKDSLELTDEDRQAILEAVKASACQSSVGVWVSTHPHVGWPGPVGFTEVFSGLADRSSGAQ